jgi:hypothetical protein
MCLCLDCFASLTISWPGSQYKYLQVWVLCSSLNMKLFCTQKCVLKSLDFPFRSNWRLDAKKRHIYVFFFLKGRTDLIPINKWELSSKSEKFNPLSQDIEKLLCKNFLAHTHFLACSIPSAYCICVCVCLRMCVRFSKYTLQLHFQNSIYLGIETDYQIKLA